MSMSTSKPKSLRHQGMTTTISRIPGNHSSPQVRLSGQASAAAPISIHDVDVISEAEDANTAHEPDIIEPSSPISYHTPGHSGSNLIDDVSKVDGTSPMSEGLEPIARMTSQELKHASLSLRQETEQILRVSRTSQPIDAAEGEELTYMNPNVRKKDVRKVGAFAGVFVPTCENMWGVLIFLRFYLIIGHAGVIQALCAVLLSFSTAFLTACSMSAMASSGGFVSEGGPYYMISRAMGPIIGATVGLLYWLGISLLAVLEVLGAVEAFLIARPELVDLPAVMQMFGTVLMLLLVLCVYGGIRFVTKLGIFFVVCVAYTLLSFYIGLCDVDLSKDYKGPDGEVTGLRTSTLEHNKNAHYADGVNFGTVLSWFFPCFTGILSGANRADILKDPPRDLKRGTLGAICFSLLMYSSFMVLWGSVAKYTYLRGDWNDWKEGKPYRNLQNLQMGGLDSEGGMFSVGFNPLSQNLSDTISKPMTSSVEYLLSGSVTAAASYFSFADTVKAATGFGDRSGSASTNASGSSSKSEERSENASHEDSSAEKGHPRRLAGGSKGAYVFEEIAWTPFKYSPHIGIIISSISQALQCLIVAPRLLQAIARDHVVSLLSPIAPLSKDNEPIRALGITYIVCASLVLIGQLNVVAPLLTMCFLACYINMNISCWVLTMLKAPSWRPAGIARKRWRMWYKFVGLTGATLGIIIMFVVQWAWALITGVLAVGLYCYIDYKTEVNEWGSGLDGIKFHIALSSLLSLEQTQRHRVNWRPQVLILYRVHLSDIVRKDPNRTRHHEILQFYSQLRKGRGMCVVAAVLEGDRQSEKMLKKAQIEKDIIVSIMKQNDILGFAEVVVAPNWGEGANYILQLTGLGGLVPNTVLMNWPFNWRANDYKTRMAKAFDFCNIVKAANAEEKTILVAKDPKDFPGAPCHGTIDVWWMIHDGGLMILITWLLQQHKIWRSCKMRVFTVMEEITEEEAKLAARVLTRTLQKKRLLNVDVEVILAEDSFIEPYLFDRSALHSSGGDDDPLGALTSPSNRHKSSGIGLPQSIDDLLPDTKKRMSMRHEHQKHSPPRSPSQHFLPDINGSASDPNLKETKRSFSVVTMKPDGSTVQEGFGVGESTDADKFVLREIDDVHTDASSKNRRKSFTKALERAPKPKEASHTRVVRIDQSNSSMSQFRDLPQAKSTPGIVAPQSSNTLSVPKMKEKSVSVGGATHLEISGNEGSELPSVSKDNSRSDVSFGRHFGQMQKGRAKAAAHPVTLALSSPKVGELATKGVGAGDAGAEPFPEMPTALSTTNEHHSILAFRRLNSIIQARSRRAELVIMNLPDMWNTEDPRECEKYVRFCDALVSGLDRVLFVHSSGQEVFDIGG